MQRRSIELPLLATEDREPFAQEWIDATCGELGCEEIKQPKTYELAAKACSDLEKGRKLYPGGRGWQLPAIY